MTWLGPQDFQRYLDELRPGVSNYEWMWPLLRARFKQNGWFPRRLHSVIKRFGNPKKPYFIGQTPDGLRFLGDYRDVNAVACATTFEYPGPFICFMMERMKQTEGAFLDVGANLGFVASYLARSMAGRDEVFAFEPIPETTRRAAATFALNDLHNVRLFPVAVGDEEGDITFYDAPGNSEWASAHPTKQPIAIRWQETKVPCLTLDALCQAGHIGRVGLLKIDVEGHEPKVVRGAAELIRREKPVIFYEYNYSVAPFAGWSASDVALMINRSAAYRFKIFEDSGRMVDFSPPEEVGGVVNIYCECCEKAS
jgi:FkbM family methyltransferase